MTYTYIVYCRKVAIKLFNFKWKLVQFICNCIYYYYQGFIKGSGGQAQLFPSWESIPITTNIWLFFKRLVTLNACNKQEQMFFKSLIKNSDFFYKYIYSNGYFRINTTLNSNSFAFSISYSNNFLNITVRECIRRGAVVRETC